MAGNGETPKQFEFDSLHGFDAKVQQWGNSVLLPIDATDEQIRKARQRMMVSAVLSMSRQCLQNVMKVTPQDKRYYGAFIQGTPVSLKWASPDGRVLSLTYGELAQAFLDEREWIEQAIKDRGDDKQGE